jgi:hypothetical protein
MDDFEILLCVLLPFFKTRIFFIKISCMAAGNKFGTAARIQHCKQCCQLFNVLLCILLPFFTFLLSSIACNAG